MDSAYRFSLVSELEVEIKSVVLTIKIFQVLIV